MPPCPAPTDKQSAHGQVKGDDVDQVIIGFLRIDKRQANEVNHSGTEQELVVNRTANFRNQETSKYSSDVKKQKQDLDLRCTARTTLSHAEICQVTVRDFEFQAGQRRR